MKKREALKVLMTAQAGFCSRTTERVDVPFLEGSSLPITFFAQEVDLDPAADALANFCGTSASSRAVIQDRLFRAAQQSFEDCDCDFDSPQKQLDWESESTGRFSGAKVPTRSAEIWPLVNFTSIHIAPSMTATLRRYVLKVRGDCAWDGEHGVAVIFADNGSLIGVGEG